MIGDDPTGTDCDPLDPEPIAPEPLHRTASSFPDAEAHRPADLPWAAVPTGRRISFTAWGIAGGVGMLLWVAIIKLI